VIYTFPSEKRPIRQGDIFASVPRTSVSLMELPTVDDEDVHVLSWDTIAKAGKPVQVVLPVTPVYGIVVTQDCDTLTAPEITLCEIREFSKVEGKAKDAETPKSWQRIITQQARINQKWFYLPPDTKIGFTEKMAVDFRCMIRVPRTDLEKFKNSRRGCLNALARQHFRERIGHFFRRYPYNEWYPLNCDELENYEKDHKCTVSPRYAWQSKR
jgi:hypothetical protein